MKNPISKVFIFYSQEIYPKIRNKRGATRIHSLLQKISQIGIEKIKDKPEPIYEKDWDNLIILDACRHDIYQDVVGETDCRITVGSMSQEFIQKTFTDLDFSDTVLITSNPYCHKSHFNDLTGRSPEDVFHDVFHTYQTDWDDEENTVLPESVVRDAKTAEKLYPDKRKIIWFMQPHYPFIPERVAGGDAGMAPNMANQNESAWELAMQNEVDCQRVKECYKQNLDFVLDYVSDLILELGGIKIVTSDHGNLIGENNLYGHSVGNKEKKLRKVPLQKL